MRILEQQLALLKIWPLQPEPNGRFFRMDKRDQAKRRRELVRAGHPRWFVEKICRTAPEPSFEARVALGRELGVKLL
jgi:hypothetical protein